VIAEISGEEVQRVGLARVLKIRHVAAIALGFTVADGILLLLSQLFPVVGPSVIVVTLVGGIAYSLVLFAGAELAQAMPAADFAGEWGKRTVGGFFGFIGTLSYGMVAVTGVGLLWFPMGTYLHQFFGSVPVPVIGTICFLIALVIVYQGALASGDAEIVLNVIFFSVIFVMSIVMLTRFHPEYFQPFFGTASGGYLSNAAKAFPFAIYILFGQEVMFAGSQEHVSRPRFWPKAMAVAMLIAMVCFVLMEVALVGLLPTKSYTLAEADFAIAAKIILGPIGEGVFNAIAFVAVFHALLAALFVGARVVYKMAERSFLPAFFTHINRRSRIPDRALILAALVGAAIGSTYYVKPDFYTQAAAILTVAGLFGWLVICVSHISYRTRPHLQVQYPSDWMVPGKGVAGIWISVLGIVVIAVTLFGFLYGQALAWWIIALWVGLLIVWYLIAWLVTRRQAGAVQEATAAAAPESDPKTT
jgi:amino acid transporter